MQEEQNKLAVKIFSNIAVYRINKFIECYLNEFLKNFLYNDIIKITKVVSKDLLKALNNGVEIFWPWIRQKCPLWQKAKN